MSAGASDHVREVAKRLTYILTKIDPSRGGGSAMAREARALAWILDYFVEKTTRSEFSGCRVTLNAVTSAEVATALAEWRSVAGRFPSPSAS